MFCTPTLGWSSAEASPQLVLASGQGDGVPGVTDICAPRPGSKKLHVRKCTYEMYYYKQVTSFQSVDFMIRNNLHSSIALTKNQPQPPVEECL